MFGWTEIPTDPEAEQFLNDPLATDEDSMALFELGALADGAIRRSYGLLDADLVIQEPALSLSAARNGYSSRRAVKQFSTGLSRGRANPAGRYDA